jgi:hypothetical protein
MISSAFMFVPEAGAEAEPAIAVVEDSVVLFASVIIGRPLLLLFCSFFFWKRMAREATRASNTPSAWKTFTQFSKIENLLRAQ